MPARRYLLNTNEDRAGPCPNRTEKDRNERQNLALGLALMTFPSLAMAAPSVNTGSGGPLCGKTICNEQRLRGARQKQSGGTRKKQQD